MCEEGYLLELGLGECKSTFSLENAVCNHGFFMMAPNIWFPSTKTLQRPLRLADNTKSVTVFISHPLNSDTLYIKINQHDLQLINTVLTTEDNFAILRQVSRMLRISEKDEKDVKEFHEMNEDAKKRGFGRLFRSPSLFEDAVKSILLCNCTWERSLKMAQALCELPTKLAEDTDQTINIKDSGKGGSKRKQASNSSNNANKRVKDGVVVVSNFPTARELSGVSEHFLREECNLGYRAVKILKFAKKVERRGFNITEFEESIGCKTCVQIRKELNTIKGFGDFTISNILMCIGFYQDVPADTETLRHLKQVHGLENSSNLTLKKDVKEIYSKYAPYQCLAYWFELTQDYEKKLGKLSDLDPSKYATVSGSLVSKADNA